MTDKSPQGTMNTTSLTITSSANPNTSHSPNASLEYNTSSLANPSSLPNTTSKILDEYTTAPLPLTDALTSTAPVTLTDANTTTAPTSHSALFGLTGQSSPTKFAGSGPGSGVIGTMGVKGQHNTISSSDAGGLTGGKPAVEAEKGS